MKILRPSALRSRSHSFLSNDRPLIAFRGTRGICAGAFLSVSLAFGGASLFANALTPEMAKTPAQETLPAGAKITSLDVQPAKVVLHGRYEAAQLLVTAKLASGDVADVTRMAKLHAVGGIAEITPSGQISPLGNGTGTIQVEIAGVSAAVPVQVIDYKEVQPVDFIHDVTPTVSKLGCNAGTCHGAKEGKYGFKLSLRGYDPIFDVRSFKDDLASRRLNVASPDDSLMLLKATAAVPHEGGQRTKIGEKYYNILRQWIADGAVLNLNAPRVKKIEVFPHDPVVQKIGSLQQVRIVATFTDGTTRDVTAEAVLASGDTDVAKTDGGGLIDTLRRGEAPLLARYEGNYAATTLTVMGDRTGFVWNSPEVWSKVDELVSAKWERMKIQPSEVCNDSDFLRRVYLDLTGLPPSVEDLKAFLADPAPTREKRDAVVDRLIGSPDFVEYWTNKWADKLQVNSKFLGPEGAVDFRKWIRDQVDKNVPYDVFVREILTATGSNKDNPAASYWKILREPSEAMENTTQLFLATRFNCNKCHDHPFEHWTQDQYYHLGAYFTQVNLSADPASGKRVILGTAVENAHPLFEVVKDGKTGDMIHLRTQKVAAPIFPYPSKPAEEVDATTESRRQQLAEWLTSADNRYFASSYVNRLWGYLTGVGIIEPIDDTRAGNPPTNPELLEYLAKEFIQHKFDVRYIIRMICKSRTYQLSIAANHWNEDDKTNYSHASARRLGAEVLYDSVLKATGSSTRLPGGQSAMVLSDSAIDLPSGFLANLGRPARESACECERSNDLRLGSVMALLSGPAVADAIGNPKSALVKLAAEQPDDSKLINEVFERVLSRSASEKEIQKTLTAWGTIAPENATLLAQWEAREKEQAPIIAKAEADRLVAIDAAKKELSRYETEIAPRVADAEKKRVAGLAASQTAVKDYETKTLATAEENFEATVPVTRTYTEWTPLDLRDLQATGGVKLTKLPDGSIQASGLAPKKTEYVLQTDTKLAGITGVLLEALPDAGEVAFGPGRSNDGNFVLSQFVVKTGAFGAPAAPDDQKLVAAYSPFTQKNFDVAKAIDGKKGDANKGWAVSGRAAGPQYAAFKFEKPIGDAAKGIHLRIEMDQPRDTFSIARFRIWVTTSQSPLNVGLPAVVADALKKAPEFRTAPEKAAIVAYWKEYDPELSKRQLTAGKFALPLPIDPGVTERKTALAVTEEPIKLDAKLVQLRQDSEQSKSQILNKRLTGAQDLAWALINSPAFLFNH